MRPQVACPTHSHPRSQASGASTLKCLQRVESGRSW
jgi:hypothetical protein